MAILFGVECFRVFCIDRYESQVTFEVHPKGAGSRVSIFDNKSIPRDKTVDMKTQLEVIQSRNTLYQVVVQFKPLFKQLSLIHDVLTVCTCC